MEEGVIDVCSVAFRCRPEGRGSAAVDFLNQGKGFFVPLPLHGRKPFEGIGIGGSRSAATSSCSGIGLTAGSCSGIGLTAGSCSGIGLLRGRIYDALNPGPDRILEVVDLFCRDSAFGGGLDHTHGVSGCDGPVCYRRIG